MQAVAHTLPTLAASHASPACPICLDMRFVIPLVDAVPQRAAPCHCYRRQLAERQQSQALAQSRVPTRFQGVTFDDWQYKLRVEQTVLNRCREFAHDPAGWLILTGNAVRTDLAYAIANTRLQAGESVFVVSSADFLDLLRNTFDSGGYDMTFRSLRQHPLLILLDVGWESQTAWGQEKLYQLLTYRHAWQLPLVLTTAIVPAQLDTRIAHLLAALSPDSILTL